MNKEKKLVKNTMIFAIGNIGSKMLQFIMLPYYTGVLNTIEYGTVDFLQTIGMLIIPIISAAIYEAVFRYAMDSHYDKKEVFSVGIITWIAGNIIMIFVGVFLNAYEYTWIVILYISINVLRNILSQFLRAIGKVKLYTVDSILYTFFIVVFNILYLSFFSLKIDGYLMAYNSAGIISIILLSIVINIKEYLSVQIITKKTVYAMFAFSIPLIPNTVCWWISNSSDRLMITHWLGESVNGVYAISNKVPTIVTILVGIFFQAWQISANEEYENKNLDIFFGQVLKYLQTFVVLLCLGLIGTSKIIVRIIASKGYYDAWEYMIPLLVGITWYSYAQLLGSVYSTFKQTKMALITNLASAVVNIVLNIALIFKLGALGAAIATAVSYFVLFICRLKNTEKIIKIPVDRQKFIENSVAIIGAAIIMLTETKFGTIFYILDVIIVLYLNKDEIVYGCKNGIKLLRKG